MMLKTLLITLKAFIQCKEKANKYLFEPFPSKDELLDKYEAGLDSPYEDLSDIDNLSDEEQSTIITEQKARVSNVYNKIQKEREAFMKTVG